MAIIAFPLIPCDCLNDCGDDSRLEKGIVNPCERWKAWAKRPRIVGVSRVADDTRAVVVHFNAEPYDADMRALHTLERWPSP
jgi:hypothetical protein